jgi:hypothetical protein
MDKHGQATMDKNGQTTMDKFQHLIVHGHFFSRKHLYYIGYLYVI